MKNLVVAMTGGLLFFALSLGQSAFANCVTSNGVSLVERAELTDSGFTYGCFNSIWYVAVGESWAASAAPRYETQGLPAACEDLSPTQKVKKISYTAANCLGDLDCYQNLLRLALKINGGTLSTCQVAYSVSSDLGLVGAVVSHTDGIDAVTPPFSYPMFYRLNGHGLDEIKDSPVD